MSRRLGVHGYAAADIPPYLDGRAHFGSAA
jgi:hypothetical protein